LVIGKANNKVFFPKRSTLIRGIWGAIWARLRLRGNKLERKKKGNTKRDPKEKKKTRKKKKRGYEVGISVRWFCNSPRAMTKIDPWLPRPMNGCLEAPLG
jgi:hypothetical protein